MSKTPGTAPSSIPPAAPAAEPPAAAPAAEPPIPAPAAEPPAAAPAVKPPMIPVSDKMFAEGMAALQEGGHERALELFSAAWQEKPGHAGVAREFDGALLALKKNGDAAYAQGKWEDAGKRWMGTLRFITHPAANSRDYPFTRSEVRANVDHLSASLLEKALLQYRKGNIQAAIADWKTILAYDPANEEAVKSLNTATTQLEQLKKLPPAPAPAPSPAPAAK
jgi:thioredoxin-like negative regulator of GroEL